MHSLGPVNHETTVVGNVDFPSHDGDREAVTMSDPHQLLLLSEALDVVNGNSSANVALVIRLPVLHEVVDLLDVDTGARDLP